LPKITVPESASGARLDLFIARQVPGLGRARARALVVEGRVRVNGREPRKGDRLSAGDLVELDDARPPSHFVLEPDPELDLAIVHQDRFLVVVDKPAGIPCHPLRPGERRTVASALVARFPEMVGIGSDPREAGLVHRLDTGTSGLLIAARDRNSLARLRKAVKAGGMEKRYRALCAGRVEAPQQVSNWLRSYRGRGRRVRVVLGAGKRTRPALTEILASEPVGELSLVDLRVHVARRHQIRAHLGWLGHPLAGDTLYGGPELPGLERHFLHASEIRFAHPEDTRALCFSSELPRDLQAVLESLR
jgi:23S rRNA pseudouridine1911/1915/1917 synthase